MNYIVLYSHLMICLISFEYKADTVTKTRGCDGRSHPVAAFSLDMCSSLYKRSRGGLTGEGEEVVRRKEILN